MLIKNKKMTESLDNGPIDDLLPAHAVDPLALEDFNKLVGEWKDAADQVHAYPEQIPEPTDNGLGLHFGTITLYHGGIEPNIRAFRESSDTTIGAGLYTTSMPDQAFGYAVVRAEQGGFSRHKTPKGIVEPEKQPVVYELALSDVTFADLRKQENIDRVLPGGFADYLEQWIAQHEPGEDTVQDISEKQAMLAMSSRLAELRKTEKVFAGAIKIAIGNDYRVGQVFTEYLTSLGYDGLIATEGGEISASKRPYIGGHDSWVIFDPGTVEVTEEVSFKSPEVTDDAAMKHNADVRRSKHGKLFGEVEIPPPHPPKPELKGRLALKTVV